MKMESIKIREIQFKAIDIMRFPLAIMIVAIHTYFNESLNLRGTEISFSGEWAHRLIKLCSVYLTDCAVPMFFVISGYLYFLNTPTITRDIYIDKTKKKLISIMIPFILWSVVSICVSPSNFINATLTEKIVGFWSRPWNGPLWFLRDLFVLMLFSPIIEKFLRRIGYWPIILFILIQKLNFTVLLPGFSARAFIFFSFGAWLAIKKPNFSQTLTRKKRMFIIFVGIFMLLVRYVTGNNLPEVAWYISQIWLWCQMALYWVIALIIAEKTKDVSMWQKLASSGMVIFCMHRIINSKISAVGLLILDKPEITGVEAVTLYFITIFLTVVICYGAYFFISKYKIFSLLFMGRKLDKRI